MNMKAMTITVVVPVYNERPADIAGHLAMLRMQEPDEIIVVDDGSAVPVEVPAGVKLIRSQKNAGVPAALNLGMLSVKTTHVLFSAVGDNLTWGYLHSIRRYAKLSATGNYDTYAARAVFSRPDGFKHVSSDWGFEPIVSCTEWNYYDARFIEHSDARGELQIISHTAVFAVGQLTEPFNELAEWHCDWLMTHKIAYTHGLVFSPQIAVEIKTSPDSYSGRGMDDFNAQLDVMFALDTLISREMRAAGALGAFGWPALWFCLWNHPRDINKAFLKKAGRRIAERLAWKYAPRWLLEWLNR